MDLFLSNFTWIILNVSLAFLGVLFGLLFYLTKKYTRFIFFILWLFFVPNTIYLITDVQYLPGQLIETNFLGRLLLIGEYGALFLLGIITFFLALAPVEKIYEKRVGRQIAVAIFLANYLIAFGVFLGKIYRVHSWFILTKPQDVVAAVLEILNSPQILLAVFLFGTLFNFLFFYIGEKFGIKSWAEKVMSSFK